MDEKNEEIQIEQTENEEDFLYELQGVLVHSGTADVGHYYSYVKDRNDPKQTWYEFNDQQVFYQLI